MVYEFVAEIKEYEGDELVDTTIVKFLTKKEIKPRVFHTDYEKKFHSLPIPESSAERGVYAHVLDEIAKEHRGTWELVKLDTVVHTYLYGDNLTPNEAEFLESLKRSHPEIYWMGVFLKGGMADVIERAWELGVKW